MKRPKPEKTATAGPSRAEFEAFFEHSCIPMGVVSIRDGNWIKANPALTRVLGDTGEKLPGNPILERIHPEDAPRMRELLAGVSTEGRAASLECRHRVDRIYRPILWEFWPGPETGSVCCVAKEFEGATPPKSNILPSSSRKDSSHPQAAGPQVLWETDAFGKGVVDFPGWRKFTGQSVDEWFQEGWLGAVHSDDRKRAEKLWSKAVCDRKPINARLRISKPDGGFRQTLMRIVPLLSKDGSVSKWIGANVDVAAFSGIEYRLKTLNKRIEADLGAIQRICEISTRLAGENDTTVFAR